MDTENCKTLVDEEPREKSFVHGQEWIRLD